MEREEILKMVKGNGLNLEYVHNQDKEICLTAVRQDGNALYYVMKQDKEICLLAVKQNVETIKYIKDEEMLNEILKELNILYLSKTYHHRGLIIKDNLCWIGCQEGITIKKLVDRIYNKDGGLEENPHRQFYLDFLKENNLI